MARLAPRSTLFPYTTLFRSHGIDRDLGLRDFSGEMAFPDRVAAEFFAHEHLQQHRADRLDGDRKSTRLNSSHLGTSYAVLWLNKTKRRAAPSGCPYDAHHRH